MKMASWLKVKESGVTPTGGYYVEIGLKRRFWLRPSFWWFYLRHHGSWKALDTVEHPPWNPGEQT